MIGPAPVAISAADQPAGDRAEADCGQLKCRWCLSGHSKQNSSLNRNATGPKLAVFQYI
jgi:hypothetical protein